VIVLRKLLKSRRYTVLAANSTRCGGSGRGIARCDPGYAPGSILQHVAAAPLSSIKPRNSAIREFHRWVAETVTTDVLAQLAFKSDTIKADAPHLLGAGPTLGGI